MVGFPVACNLASVMNSFFGSSCVFSFLFLEKGISALLRNQVRGQHLKKIKMTIDKIVWFQSKAMQPLLYKLKYRHVSMISFNPLFII